MTQSLENLAELIKKKRQEIADKKTAYAKTFSFKQGKTTIRILPSKDGDFSRTFGLHYIKDKDDNLIAVCGDNEITYGEPCEVRALIQTAISEARTPGEKEHYKKMLAKRRTLVNVLVVGDKDIDPNTPQLVAFSDDQFSEIISQIDDFVLNKENPLSLKDGYDLIVEREGSGVLNTRYKLFFARKPREVPESVMDNLIDMDAWLRSKMAETSKATNAIRALSKSRPQLSYNGSANNQDSSLSDREKSKLSNDDDDITDGEFDEVLTNTANNDDIDALLAELEDDN